MSFFSHLEKHIVRFSDWLELICERKLMTLLFSDYISVYNKFRLQNEFWPIVNASGPIHVSCSLMLHRFSNHEYVLLSFILIPNLTES